jgi:hypothetical protein
MKLLIMKLGVSEISSCISENALKHALHAQAPAQMIAQVQLSFSQSILKNVKITGLYKTEFANHS